VNICILLILQADKPSGAAPARHAVLHDFCMCIPYGAIALLAGVGLFFLNLTNIAGTALVAGATALAASVLSLQEWKAGGDSKQYTLISSGAEGVRKVWEARHRQSRGWGRWCGWGKRGLGG
jgi:hypothetical protein